MDLQKWFNDQNIEAVQDRKDGKNYWNSDNLYTETDLIECMDALLNLCVVGVTLKDKNTPTFEEFRTNNFKRMGIGKYVYRIGVAQRTNAEIIEEYKQKYN
jgi:hypothetical protein